MVISTLWESNVQNQSLLVILIKICLICVTNDVTTRHNCAASTVHVLSLFSIHDLTLFLVFSLKTTVHIKLCQLPVSVHVCSGTRTCATNSVFTLFQYSLSSSLITHTHTHILRNLLQAITISTFTGTPSASAKEIQPSPVEIDPNTYKQQNREKRRH